MKNYKYKIVFTSKTGSEASFEVYAACFGNALAIAWNSLEEKFGTTKDWKVLCAVEDFEAIPPSQLAH